MRRRSLVCLALTLLALASYGCAMPARLSVESRSRATSTPSDTSPLAAARKQVSPKIRFVGPGFLSAELNAEDLIGDTPEEEKRLPTLAALRRSSSYVRLPSSTLGGKPFFASLGEMRCRVYYDNGIQLEEQWGEFGQRRWPGKHCSGLAGAASIELTVGPHQAYAAEESNSGCVECHGAATTWCGDTTCTPTPKLIGLQASFVSWKADGSRYLLTSYYHDAKALQRVAESMR